MSSLVRVSVYKNDTKSPRHSSIPFIHSHLMLIWHCYDKYVKTQSLIKSKIRNNGKQTDRPFSNGDRIKRCKKREGEGKEWQRRHQDILFTREKLHKGMQNSVLQTCTNESSHIDTIITEFQVWFGFLYFPLYSPMNQAGYHLAFSRYFSLVPSSLQLCLCLGFHS